MPLKSVPIPYSSHLINNNNMAKVRTSGSEVTLTLGSTTMHDKICCKTLNVVKLMLLYVVQ